jgi:hypothetical protein
MAVTYQSVQTNTPANQTSTVITKPTSLGVGDLMVAHIGAVRNGGMDITAPAGWTLIRRQSRDTGVEVEIAAFYKVATSDDVAASDFTFSATNTSSLFIGGAIYRITGGGVTTIIDASNSTSASSQNVNVDASITPTRANDLILMLGGANGASSTISFSSQAIATSNPTWTERYDMTSTSTLGIFGATAVRPETTATGNTSYNVANSTSDTQNVVIMIAVANSLEASVTVTPGELILTAGTNLVKTGVKVLVTAGNLILTAGTTLVKKAIGWATTTKPSTTWTNLDKNE